MRSLFVLICCTAFLGFTSCRRTESPQITRSGQETFGADIDDNLWTLSSCGIVTGGSSAAGFYNGSTNTLTVTTYRLEKDGGGSFCLKIKMNGAAGSIVGHTGTTDCSDRTYYAPDSDCGIGYYLLSDTDGP